MPMLLWVLVIIALSAAVVVLGYSLVYRIIERNQQVRFGRAQFGLVRREIEENVYRNHLPILLHKLRKLALGAGELEPEWGKFWDEWLTGSYVVEGIEVNDTSLDQDKLSALHAQLAGLPMSNQVALLFAANSAGRSGQGGGLPIASDVVNIVALVVALASLVLTIMGMSSANSQFELQKRPWLRAGSEVTRNHTDCADSVYVDFQLSNHGEGAAADCRAVVVLNGDTKLLNLDRWLNENQDGVYWSFIPPGASDLMGQTKAWFDTSSSRVTSNTVAHICCSFDGLETGRHYYYEQTILLDGATHVATGQQEPPQTFTYRIMGSARPRAR
jgi:hypothetical protein